MKRSSTIFLQIVIVLVGIAVLTFLLWQPHVEGVNAHATTIREIYFDDPFLAYAYVASIPFFVALVQVFKLLGHVGRSNAFSYPVVKGLRTIRYCALLSIGFVIGGVVILLLGESDDRPPIIMIGTIMIVIAFITAKIAATLQRKVQRGMGSAPANNLTT